MSDYDDFILSLEAHGEANVRTKLAQGVWANQRKSWAEQWLKNQEAKQVADHQAATLALTAEDNATAKEANKIAQDNLAATRSAKNAAWVAAVAAFIAAIFAALTYIYSKS